MQLNKDDKDVWQTWQKRRHVPHTHIHNYFTALDFVQDNPGEPVPEETFTHMYNSDRIYNTVNRRFTA